MPTITIGSTVIDFPNSARDPNWAEPIIQFAESVSENLNSLISAADILPNSFTLDAYNGATVAIPGFTLDTSLMRGVIIKYALNRDRDTTHKVEYGHILAVYNANGPINSKWELSREFVGDAGVSITSSDVGQISITLDTISGVGAHTGIITYSAQALLQS